MQNTVDARGLSCPQPVIRTKAAMAGAGAESIVTIVDNDVAKLNVTRMAEKAGWAVQVDQRTDGIYLELAKDGQVSQPAEAPASTPAGTGGPTLLLVKSDRMGTGDDVLGQVLIRSFFHTLLELEEPPGTFIFVNAGVKLAVEGSPVLEDLRILESRGVEILVCGTCLGHFELTEKLGAGSVSNMYSIAETLMEAGKVVSP